MPCSGSSKKVAELTHVPVLCAGRKGPISNHVMVRSSDQYVSSDCLLIGHQYQMKLFGGDSGGG